MLILQEQEADSIHSIVLFRDAVQRAEHQIENLLLVISFSIAMVAYVGYFTILRFQREQFERE